ncbi:MAG: hypothetical protein KGO53_14450 [Alphaproteobacteria bacterium]|nr:hypothetical protein [Alphaproteobacteria bacterium]
MAVFLAVMLLSGGISGVAPPMIYVHAGVAIALAAAALTRLYLHGFPTRLAVWGTWVALAALALVFIQLIPLPPALWQTIPGHEWALSSLKMAGTAPGWMPLTLSPEATRQSALCMLPPLAVFLAALTLRARNANVVAAQNQQSQRCQLRRKGPGEVCEPESSFSWVRKAQSLRPSWAPAFAGVTEVGIGVTENAGSE